MFSYIWPIALVVLSNIVYQICTKSVPEKMNPFASLTITYVIGAVASLILYFALGKGGNFFRELSKVNWAPFVLGIVIVGLEVGWIYRTKRFSSCMSCFCGFSALQGTFEMEQDSRHRNLSCRAGIYKYEIIK